MLPMFPRAFSGLLENAQNFGKHPLGIECMLSKILDTLKLVPNFTKVV